MTPLPLFLATRRVVSAVGCDSAEGPPAEVAFDATVQTLVPGGPSAFLLSADTPGTVYETPSPARVQG